MVGTNRRFVYAAIKHIFASRTDVSARDLRSGGFYVLSFADLLEIRNIHSFNQSGVQIAVLAETARHARERFDTDYPFSDRRFMTDGAEVFAETAIGLEDISDRSQLAFEEIVEPSLFEPVDYDCDEPIRWYPTGEWGLGIEPKSVCLDPAYAFGAPILTEYRVRTETLKDSYLAEGCDIQVAASTYDVSIAAVKHALEFEREKERRRSLVEA